MRKLFITAAAVAALIATGTLTSPSDAKTIIKPVGVHKVIKVKPAKAFATGHMVCHRGSWHHHGRCVVVKRHHHARHG
jgi:hypothetical protein